MPNFRTIIAIVLFALICSQEVQTSADAPIAADTEEQSAMTEFQQFLRDHNKTYESLDEMSAKYKIFKANYVYVKAKQVKNAGKSNKHSVGVTKFMDLTPEQFKTQLG